MCFLSAVVDGKLFKGIVIEHLKAIKVEQGEILFTLRRFECLIDLIDQPGEKTTVKCTAECVPIAGCLSGIHFTAHILQSAARAVRSRQTID